MFVCFYVRNSVLVRGEKRERDGTLRGRNRFLVYTCHLGFFVDLGLGVTW